MKVLYPSLAPDQRRKEAVGSKSLDELIDHLQSSNALDPAFRRSSIRTITSDLTAYLSGGTDWSAKTTLSALVSLKHLGRSGVATEELASHFTLLTTYANLLPAATLQLDKQNSSRVQSTLSDPLVVQESLRILANALFLHPLSRSSADLLPALKSLAELAVSPLENSSRQSSETTISHENHDTNSFLASRVIFLITAVPSNLVIELIEKTSLVRSFKKAFEQELANKLNPDIHSYRHIYQDTLIEHLKIIFNVMVHYPKSILQFDHTTLDAVNESSSPTVSNPGSCHGSPSAAVASPSSPRRLSSLKQRFNNQINFKKFRFRNQSESSDGQDHQDASQETAPDNDDNGSSNQNSKRNFFPTRNSSHSKVCSQSSTAADEPQELLGPVTIPANTVFAGLLPCLVQLFLLEPIPQPPNLKRPFNSYMQTFLNFLPSAHCFFDDYSNVPREPPTSSWNPKIPPLINKLIMIIDRVTEYYCPEDPDDRLVKQKCQSDGIDLDVDLTQVFLLTANLISPHPSNSSSSSSPVGLTKEHREALVEMIIPPDVDRSIGLNKQANLIGRILRLMNSVGLETLKQTCGGFLEALYANDTDLLASQVGYGPLVGYLVSIGKPALSPENNKHISNPDINPITGTYWTTSAEEESADTNEVNPSSSMSTMSDAEKEREAERLCDLFDRMNRGGVISVEDPRKLAVQSGRFQEIEDSLNTSQLLQDQLDEDLALKDLQKYKDKKINTQSQNLSNP